MRNSVQDLTRNTSAGLSPADVDTVQKRLAELEQAARKATSDIAVRLALSAAALRDAVVSGSPFTAELAQAKSLGADEKILAPLAPFVPVRLVVIAAAGLLGGVPNVTISSPQLVVAGSLWLGAPPSPL